MTGTVERCTVERCLGGRLASAYPAARHDVELRVTGVPVDELPAVLAAESERVLAGDAACRKVVFAAPAGDLATIAAAEAAGFRYVVDVDVVDPGGRPAGPPPARTEPVGLALLVREPERVTRVDMDLDVVPQT